jgi:transcriptional regulator with XRE-family HTH domain
MSNYKIEGINKRDNIFAIRVHEECSRLNKSINQVERDLGYPRNSLHNYKEGGFPSAIRLLELAHYFDVTPQYLAGEVNPFNRREMRALFRGLSWYDKKELCFICQDWLLTPLKNKEINKGYQE